jgi:YVTN family beta-propeller protein
MRAPILLLCVSALWAQPDVAVVEKIAGKVGFYSAAGKRVAEVKIGTYPHEIVPSLDGKTLFVSNNGILWMQYAGEGGNTIAMIDRKARTKIGDIDLGNNRRPHGITVHPKTGHLVITTENPDGLILVDPVAKKVLRRFDVKGEDPHMVLFDKPGEWAYVSNSTTGTVAAIRIATGETILIPTGKRPQGGVLSPDGKTIYLTNADSNAISLIDTAQRKVVGEIKTGGGPNRVTITPDGKTLVYSLGAAHSAAFADVATRKELQQVKLSGQPLSLTMSRDGKWAFSGVQDKDKVHIIDVAQRKIVRTIDTPKESGPDPAFPLD